MEPDRLPLVVTAVMAAIVIIAMCLAVIVMSRLAANGKLPRNQWAGIRTPSTMRSEQAWVAAHRAALRLTPLYLIITAVGCAALGWAALYASTPGVILAVGAGGFAALLAGLICATIIAGRAAKSADDGPEGRRRQ